MIGTRRQGSDGVQCFEPAEHGDVKILRVGRPGRAVGSGLDDVKRLRGAIAPIDRHSAEVQVITVTPGHPPARMPTDTAG